MESARSKALVQVSFLSCAILLATAGAPAQDTGSKPRGDSASAPSETMNNGGPSAVCSFSHCSQQGGVFAHDAARPHRVYEALRAIE